MAIQKQRRLCSFFADVAFDVYILHCHIWVYDIVFLDKFSWIAEKNALLIPILVLLIASAVYIVCSVIGFLKNILFNSTLVSRIVNCISKAVDRLWLGSSLCGWLSK